MSQMSSTVVVHDKKGRRSVPVFGAESWDLQKILQQLTPVDLFDGMNISDEADVAAATTEKLTDLQISTAMSCTTCAIVFDSRGEQKEHFKTDWHRFNLKQRLKGANTVTEMDFEALADDISSISGSEGSDTTDDLIDSESSTSIGLVSNQSVTQAEAVILASKHSVLHMRTSDDHILSIHRAVLFSKREHPENVYEILNKIKNLSFNNVWIILMMSGGHFAAAVFENDSVLAHKTFHRYVVRAKCGTSQSQHDKKGSHAQSAGANIRRYNEAALAQEITELLQAWKSYIERSHLIFLKLSTHNYRYLFNKKETSHLNKNDSRIRTIPFPTHRPTFKEVKRVHTVLSSVSVTDADEDIIEAQRPVPESLPTKCQSNVDQSHLQGRDESELAMEECNIHPVEERMNTDHPLTPPGQQKLCEDSSKKRESPAKQCSETTKDTVRVADEKTTKSLPMRSEFYTSCLVGDEEKLKLLIDRLRDGTAGEDFSSVVSGAVSSSGQTMLHIACENVQTHIIQYLLEIGCDPSLSDKKNVVPYLSTKNKSARNQFRLFMGQHPDKYDYKKAQIPGPIDAEQAAEKLATERARKQEVNRKKREQLKGKKAALAVKRQADEEKDRFLALSDREKRALAAEQRILQSTENSGAPRLPLSRCHRCAADITGKIPFEYSNNVFCTPKCLREHRLSQR